MSRAGAGPRVPPLVWVALFAGAMALSHWLVPILTWQLPAQTLLAAALIFCGIGVMAAGVLAFRRHGTTVNPMTPGRASGLVSSGIYRVTRNPMYLGMALLLLGLALGMGSLSPLLIAGLFPPVLTRFQIRHEEAALRGLFGTAYDGYAARVPRWFLV